jgi:hypothetical protein
VGDVYRLHITNTSDTRIYFSVLDIYPNGIKSCLIPDLTYETTTAADCTLGPGESKTLPEIGYQISETFGKETLKLIVTKEPWDICQVIQSKGAGSRGPGELNPLELMLSETYKLETSRAVPLAAPSKGVAIHSFTYTIVK